MGNKYLSMNLLWNMQCNAFVSGVQLVLFHGPLTLSSFYLFCLESCSMFNIQHLLLPNIFLLVLIYSDQGNF